MKIEVLKPKGYCSGVTLAIKCALKAKEENKDTPVYVLGMLVHNKETIDFLKEKGIITLSNENNDLFELIKEVPSNSVLIFTAHGHAEKLDEIAKSKNIKIYDATCPMVRNNINLIKDKIKEGYQIIFIGKKNHPETNAMLSISPNVKLYDDNLLNNYLKTTNSTIFVTNQTTSNYDELEETHQKILNVCPNAIIQNEVCNTTRLRQKSLKSLADDTDLIIIVGSKESNNTMKLYDIAVNTYPRAKVIRIEGLLDIEYNDLLNKKHIAIVSGASTPPSTVDMIYESLVKLIK